MTGQTVRRPLVVLNEAERSLNRSGRQRCATELRYASTWLQNAGWLLKKSGTWQITDEGRSPNRRVRTS